MRWTLAVAAGCGGSFPTEGSAISELRAPPPGSARYGAFAGHTPCAACEKLKVALTLHASAEDGAPTTFLLERVFVGSGDTRSLSAGTWERCNTGCHLLRGSTIRTRTCTPRRAPPGECRRHRAAR